MVDDGITSLYAGGVDDLGLVTFVDILADVFWSSFLRGGSRSGVLGRGVLGVLELGYFLKYSDPIAVFVEIGGLRQRQVESVECFFGDGECGDDSGVIVPLSFRAKHCEELDHCSGL